PGDRPVSADDRPGHGPTAERPHAVRSGGPLRRGGPAGGRRRHPTIFPAALEPSPPRRGGGAQPPSQPRARHSRDSMRALVVIPTYNEAESIETVISKVVGADQRVEVLVVDDSSPDGTAGLVAKLAGVDQRIHLLRRPGKQGLGVAYRAGFAWGMERGYDA